MNQILFFSVFPLFLTGCVGSIISGNTEHLSSDYPNILTVPERKEAMASRCLYKGGEKASRAADFKGLELDREKIKARDQALREGGFPNSQDVEKE